MDEDRIVKIKLEKANTIGNLISKTSTNLKVLLFGDDECKFKTKAFKNENSNVRRISKEMILVSNQENNLRGIINNLKDDLINDGLINEKTISSDQKNTDNSKRNNLEIHNNLSKAVNLINTKELNDINFKEFGILRENRDNKDNIQNKQLFSNDVSLKVNSKIYNSHDYETTQDKKEIKKFSKTTGLKSNLSNQEMRKSINDDKININIDKTVFSEDYPKKLYNTNSIKNLNQNEGINRETFLSFIQENRSNLLPSKLHSYFHLLKKKKKVREKSHCNSNKSIKIPLEEKKNYMENKREISLNLSQDNLRTQEVVETKIQMANTSDDIFLIKSQEASHKILNKDETRKIKKFAVVSDSLSEEEDIEIDIKSNYLIYPNSDFKKIWDWVILIFTFYLLVTTPLFFAFGDIHSFIFILEILIDFIFFCDLIIQFFVPFQDFYDSYVLNHKLIFLNYLFGWLVVDFLAAIPAYSISYFNDLNSYQNTYLLKMMTTHDIILSIFKFSKLLKILKIILEDPSDKNKEKNANYFDNLDISSGEYRVIFFSFLFIFLSHLLTCIWIYIGRFDDPNWMTTINISSDDKTEAYIASLYFNLTTIFTIGYGDILSVSIYERIYNILLMGFGVALYSYAVSSISSLMTIYDDITTKFLNNIELIEEVRKKYPLTKELYLKLLKFVKYDFKNNKTSKYDFIRDLPNKIKDTLLNSMYTNIISCYTLFKYGKNLNNEAFNSKIILSLRPLRLFKGDIFLREGDKLNEVILITNGVLVAEIEFKKKINKIFELRKFDYFGDLLALSNQSSPINLRVKSKVCEIYIIKKTDFVNIAYEFPDICKEIFKVSSENFKRMKKIIRKKTSKMEKEAEKEIISIINIAKKKFDSNLNLNRKTIKKADNIIICKEKEPTISQKNTSTFTKKTDKNKLIKKQKLPTIFELDESECDDINNIVSKSDSNKKLLFSNEKEFITHEINKSSLFCDIFEESKLNLNSNNTKNNLILPKESKNNSKSLEFSNNQNLINSRPNYSNEIISSFQKNCLNIVSNNWETVKQKKEKLSYIHDTCNESNNCKKINNLTIKKNKIEIDQLNKEIKNNPFFKTIFRANKIKETEDNFFKENQNSKLEKFISENIIENDFNSIKNSVPQREFIDKIDSLEKNKSSQLLSINQKDEISRYTNINKKILIENQKPIFDKNLNKSEKIKILFEKDLSLSKQIESDYGSKPKNSFMINYDFNLTNRKKSFINDCKKKSRSSKTLKIFDEINTKNKKSLFNIINQNVSSEKIFYKFKNNIDYSIEIEKNPYFISKKNFNRVEKRFLDEKKKEMKNMIDKLDDIFEILSNKK